MKSLSFKSGLFTGLCMFLCFVPLQSQHRLYYNEPAVEWNSALPLGNGRIGAMVYGGVSREQIQFNEETLWTGGPHDYAHEGAYEHLDEIRTLLNQGKQKAAEELAMEEFMSDPLHQKAYQPFGDLLMDFPGHENYRDYVRELDLEEAIGRTSYEVNGVKYMREVFVSEPNQLLVVHLNTDKEGALDFSVALSSLHFMKSLRCDGDVMELSVQIPDGALHGLARLRVISDGKVIPAYDRMEVRGASSATILLAARTNFINFQDVNGNPDRETRADLAGVEDLDYETLRAKHVDDYSSLYDRFELKLGKSASSVLPTDERIRNFWKEHNDPDLLALYVQYARYLMISSSRPGTQPANLQGIWNDQLSPPWDSKYTVNINAEMNYWPVEICNLSECHEPLFAMLEDLSVSGAAVAREHYAVPGWVLHHNTDIWRGAAPINHSNHGLWVSGGAWLSTHIWEHYLFTRDEDFLRERYPLMRDAALFFTGFLVEDPASGYLISTPSNSPENGGLVAGPTMDHQIIRTLLRACVEAAEILETDQEFASELEAMIPKIAPNQVGRLGQLQEWMQDVDSKDNHHRHVSHMWAVHPGSEINPLETPDLMKAARQSMVYRGDEGTGWSLAWKINLWSRFREGDRVYDLVHMLLSPAEEPGRTVRGGSYPNLFDAHPPFQIDGNFGGAAGIVEMLIQSHLGSIDLLPALPEALDKGEISGVCARGGFDLSFSWEDGKLSAVKVLSKTGSPCILKYGEYTREFKTRKGEIYRFDGRLKKI